MKNPTTTPNALIQKKGEFIIKDQIIFHYANPITTRGVKMQVQYLLGKKATKAVIVVKELDKANHIFLVAAPGAHTWGLETIGKLTNPKPVPPIPPPIIPRQVSRNTLVIQQNGIKNVALFTAAMIKSK